MTFPWPPGTDDFEVEAEVTAPRYLAEPTVELTVYALSHDAEARELNDWERLDWLDQHGAVAVEHALHLAEDEAVSAAERRAEGP